MITRVLWHSQYRPRALLHFTRFKRLQFRRIARMQSEIYKELHAIAFIKKNTRNLESVKRHALCTRVPDELCFS